MRAWHIEENISYVRDGNSYCTFRLIINPTHYSNVYNVSLFTNYCVCTVHSPIEKPGKGVEYIVVNSSSSSSRRRKRRMSRRRTRREEEKKRF